MAGSWDAKLKMLVTTAPQDIISWLLADATFERELSPHLQSRNIDADMLYSIAIEGHPCLLHIEFQRLGDATMAKRVWEYNVLATCKFDLPVHSFVLYLKKGVKVAVSPYIWTAYNQQAIHQFHFHTIKLWEIPTDEVLQSGLKGLLPLLPLTREGKRREVIEQAIEGLMPAREKETQELLALTYGIAALVFQEENEHNWLKRRFRMLGDILSESWAFQEIMQEGWDKAAQQQLQQLRQTLSALTEARFPELVPLVEEQSKDLQDTQDLHRLILQAGTAQHADAFKSYLLNFHASQQS